MDQMNELCSAPKWEMCGPKECMKGDQTIMNSSFIFSMGDVEGSVVLL